MNLDFGKPSFYMRKRAWFCFFWDFVVIFIRFFIGPRFNCSVKTMVCISVVTVVDPNTLNLDPDPGFWAMLDPDPGLPVYNQF